MNKLIFLLTPLFCISISCSEWPLSTNEKTEEIDWAVFYPVWVSDTRIAAIIQRGIAYEGSYIYEFDALTGENPTCLTQRDSLKKVSLIASFDRTKLAYGAADAGKIFSAQQMYVLDRISKKLVRVTEGGHQERPEFSPDGSMLIYDSGYRTAPPQNGGEIGAGNIKKVHIHNIDGTGRRPLDPRLSSQDKDGHFLADGNHIVLQSGRTMQSTGDTKSGEVYLTDLYGENWINLSIEDYGSSFPRPSPDGKALLFYSPAGIDFPGDDPRDDPPGLKILDLGAVINAAPSNVLRYKALRFPHIWKEAKWSPDGQWIAIRAIQAMSDGKARIYVIRPDGSQLTQLTYGKDVESFDWSPNSKRMVFYDASSNADDRYVYLVSVPSGEISKVLINLKFTK